MSSAKERLVAYRRTITIIAVIIVLYLSYLIVRPFLMAIIGAAVLAYIFYPVYRMFERRIPNPLPRSSLASILTVILIVLIVLVPMIFIAGVLAREARSGYIFIQQYFSRPGFAFNLPPVLTEKFGVDIASLRQPMLNLASQFINWVQGVVKSLPGAFLNIFITIFSIYFFLKGGRGINKFLQEFFPLPEGRYKQVFSRFDELSRGIVMGQIVVGILHGILAWIAYTFIGIANPVLWAFLTAIISIIPVLGAGLVWFPIAVYLIAAGMVTGSYWQGISLMVYGFLVMSMIDNLLKPKIIGDNARVHPLIVLFGILGGIQLFGLPGILLGPLVLALFDVVMSIFREVI
ncbi:MAG: AI-2E family transporter [bacterium]